MSSGCTIEMARAENSDIVNGIEKMATVRNEFATVYIRLCEHPYCVTRCTMQHMLWTFYPSALTYPYVILSRCIAAKQLSFSE